MTRLDRRYPELWRRAEMLLGEGAARSALPRATEIWRHAEMHWRSYLGAVSRKPVRFLLIAEAPPCVAGGLPIQYFLDPESRSRSLATAVFRAFDVAGLSPTMALAGLAQRGFLLVDSIPLPLRFADLRGRVGYSALVSEAVSAHLLPTLTAREIRWDRNVRVAFAFRRNARAVMQALGHRLSLGTVSIDLADNLIVANRAGFPSASLLRTTFAL